MRNVGTYVWFVEVICVSEWLSKRLLSWVFARFEEMKTKTKAGKSRRRAEGSV